MRDEVGIFDVQAVAIVASHASPECRRPTELTSASADSVWTNSSLPENAIRLMTHDDVTGV